MSTEYNYDEQVCGQRPKSQRHTDTSLGSIFPLLHPYYYRLNYLSPHLFAPQTQQRYASRNTSLAVLEAYANEPCAGVDPENTAPRIHSDFKPPHADLVEGQKRKQKRRERKLKRMIAVILGYLLMGYML